MCIHMLMCDVKHAWCVCLCVCVHAGIHMCGCGMLYVYEVCSMCVSIRVTRAGYTLCVHVHVSLCVGEYVRKDSLAPRVLPILECDTWKAPCGGCGIIRPLFHDFSQGPADAHTAPGVRAQLQQNRPVRPWTASPSGPSLLC